MISLRIQWLVALVFGIAVALYSLVFFDGSERNYRLWYYLPAASLAGAFIVDRYNQGQSNRAMLGLDIIIGISCLMRPLTGYPPFSGHAVFSIYVLLTCASISTRILGSTLLIITLYAKLVLWKGDPTLIPGLIVGLGAGILYKILVRKFPRNDRTVQNHPL